MIYQNKQKYKNKRKFLHGAFFYISVKSLHTNCASPLLLQQTLEKLAWRILLKIVWYCGMKHCKAKDAKFLAYRFYS